MGSACSIEIHGPDRSKYLLQARTRICELELLWSRFVPSSDVSRINAACNQSTEHGEFGTFADNPLSNAIAFHARNRSPVSVDYKTIEILQFAIDASVSTHGLFNPFLANVMIANGYDRDFNVLVGKPLPRKQTVSRPVPLVSSTTTAKSSVRVRQTSAAQPSTPRIPIDIDVIHNTVTAPAGIGVDLGGVAKGYAADLVADELIEAGAHAVMIDLGGDIACRNSDVGDVVWRIVAEHPEDPSLTIGRIDLRNGGVATSSTRRRRWSTGDGWSHHVMDPRTASSSNSDVIACSIAADQCANAEVLTKVLLCQGTAARRSIGRVVPDLLMVAPDESVQFTGNWRV
jgi:FAD:protein FMN transferase